MKRKRPRRKVGRPRLEDSYELRVSPGWVDVSLAAGWTEIAGRDGKMMSGCHMKKNII